MEKAARVAVVPGDFGWSDVGSWTSAWELAAARRAGQRPVRRGRRRRHARLATCAAPDGKIVAVVGLEDIVVVDTEDALLVMPRSRAQDVRAVVNELKSRKSTKHL